MVGLNTALKSGRWWENQGCTDLNIVTGNGDGPLTLRSISRDECAQVFRRLTVRLDALCTERLD